MLTTMAHCTLDVNLGSHDCKLSVFTIELSRDLLKPCYECLRPGNRECLCSD